jgi:hypothetical protein
VRFRGQRLETTAYAGDELLLRHSLGYYHQQQTGAFFDPLMLAPLRALGRLGKNPAKPDDPVRTAWEALRSEIPGIEEPR